TVMIMVTDNDVYCRMATWTIPVTCVEGDGGDLCEDVMCEDDGNECTATECNPANGACETSNVADGTECDGGEGACSGGQCVEVDLCEGVDCDDSNECTADACDPADGSCANTNVDNGTPCADATGMCVDGACMITDLCDGVVCDDTGNECTVATCNTATGICDTMNVADGTECNGGSGACSAGDCVDNNLCDGVDCTSSNECVQDGSCDPADGQCIAGANEPAGTSCNADSGDVCDGNGACVECNTGDDCPDDGNECTAAACDGNACFQNNVMDGQVCDFGGSDGVCEAGSCVEAPQCISPGDCDDGNPCTVGDCPDGMCVFTPVDGGACEVSAGVPGTCGGGVCVGLCVGVDCTSGSQCVMDGTCDEQTGSCVAGGNEPADTICSENGGSVCDGGGNCVECNVDGQCDVELSETCVDNTCVAGATACNDGLPQTQTVQIGCSNGVTDAQSPFPNQMTITVNESVLANQPFTVDASGIGAFPKFFLDAAQSTVPGGVRSAIVEGFNATVEASGAAGSILLQADAAGITPGLISFCTFPFEQVCTADADCLVAPCLPPVLVAEVPISEDCGPGGFCEGLGQGTADGPGAQCNITAAPAFCVSGDLSVPLFAPGGPEVFTAGAGPGDVTFNWAVDPTTVICPDGNARCQSSGGTIPDGALILPLSIYGMPVTNPASVGLNGIRLNVAGALFVALQCSAGTDGGACVGGVNGGIACGSDADCPGSTCVGVGVDDDIIVPTDPATLPACPIN
ncbi:MAG: hypothetical protein HKN97_03125, partial [Myxococcales bacterium]|nr:hypothetical protein [Myxococcales bacterium]